MKTIRSITFTVVIGLMLITQLINPTRAHAGGGSPLHPTETIVPTKVPTEASVTETPAPAEMSAPTAAMAPDVIEESVQESNTTEPTNLIEILQKLPAKIRLVALNENGEVLPLAGEQAAAMIAEGDPVWCPANQAPTPGINGCTGSYASLGDLIVAEGGAISADGTIWITTGVIPDVSAVTIDGSIYTNWSNYALTLQGGWDGIAGSTTISSNSVFSVPITITDWNNGIIIQNVDAPSIALSNVTISNGNNVSVGKQTDEYGVVNVNSNVTLDNISVTGAIRTDIYGLYITGISIITTGAITANNIATNWNGGGGASLYGSSVILTGNNEFNNNAYIGLFAASSNGDITLNQVTANGNGDDGLHAISDRDITLNQITANGNAGSGASLYSFFDNISLTGNNKFNNNGFDGIAASSNGDIALNQVTANGNGFDGISASSNGDIALNQITANGNGFDGLFAFSNGDIALNQVTANGNGGTGASLFSSSGNITLNNVTAAGSATATGNPSDVYLFTAGNATIKNSTVGILDASAVCGTLALNGTDPDIIHYPVAGEHMFFDNLGDPIIIYCDPKIYIDGILLGGSSLLSTQYEFDLSCESQTLYPRELPNGDKVTIVCPVSGRALISRLDNTTIPPDLPTGYTYASAFSVEILQAGNSIPVITEGGYIEVSFQVPSEQEVVYSILYWDNGRWVPLNDFIGPESNPQTFELNPGVTEDLRKIESGVKLVTRNGVQRVEVSTNFPGIFVLAQH